MDGFAALAMTGIELFLLGMHSGGKQGAELTKKMNLAAAYATYGCVKKTPFSWSARSKDGQTVAISVWKDVIDFPGNRDRVEDLKWARDNCDGILRVVVTVAKDVKAATREVDDCYPASGLILRLTQLNEETGEFVAVQVRK